MPGSGKIIALGGGSGTVNGPASSTNNDIPTFNGTSGASLQDSGGATLTSSALNLASAATLGWNGDTLLVRDAANIIGQRNGATTQQLNIYNTSSSANANYERVALTWNTAGNTAYLEVQNGGTGTARNLVLSTVGGTSVSIALNGLRWNFSQTSFSPNADGTQDLGGTTKRFQNLYLGNIAHYNKIATVSNGVPAEYATVDLTAQSAAISATTLYAVPASGAGMYRISYVAKVTTAATTSSVLGGTNGFQIVYTDSTDSVVTTSPRTGAPTDSGNTTTSVVSGVIIVFAKASTNIQYQFDYTSVGATAMQYNLHIKLEAM